jgi:predicted ATPase
MTQQHYGQIQLAGLSGADSYRFLRSSTTQVQALESLTQINLFVGPNNSGKSRLIRSLFFADKYRFNPAGLTWGDVVQSVRQLERAIRSLTTREQTLRGYGSVRPNAFSDLIKDDTFLDSSETLRQVQERVTAIKDERNFNATYDGGSGGPMPEDRAKRLHDQEIKPQAEDALKVIERFTVEIGDEPHVYIPILRGLRLLQGAKDDFYSTVTERDYGKPTEKNTFFTGLMMYEQLTSMLLGEHEQREAVREYEGFLGREFFDGSRVQLVPRRREGIVHIRIGDEPDRAIHQLGDGIQAVIILTFPAFTAEKRTLFFIEEPEIHLHPGLQRRLLDLYSREPRFSRHQFFATTHSNHLLDTTGDYESCAIFTLRRAGELFQISRLAARDKAILAELGANASSMFLTNAAVWVEGITDRRYIREFLRKFLVSSEMASVIKEDTHFSFIEVGGACVVHWDFSEEVTKDLTNRIRVASICTRSMLVLDGDNLNKGTRIETFKAQLGDDLLLLDAKEVENLLPETVVRAVVNKMDESIPQERLGKIKEEEYGKPGVALGSYLDQALGVSQFGADSGTIRAKTKFCDLAIAEMQSSTEWTLTSSAERVCGKIVQFVEKANGR